MQLWHDQNFETRWESTLQNLFFFIGKNKKAQALFYFPA